MKINNKSFFSFLVISCFLFTFINLKAQTLDISGGYSTDFGDVYLYQDGSSVTGEYYYTANGKEISGKIENGKIAKLIVTFTWSETSGASGTGTFKFAADGQTYTGEWKQANGTGGKWNGKKVEDMCFPLGAVITYVDGSTKNIEDVKEGDLIMGYDAEKNQFGITKVESIQIHEGDYQISKMYVQELSASSNQSISFTGLEATPNHPVLTTDGIKSMRSLKTGDIVYSSHSQNMNITQLENNFRKATKVYNLKTTSGNYIVNGIVVMDK